MIKTNLHLNVFNFAFFYFYYVKAGFLTFFSRWFFGFVFWTPNTSCTDCWWSGGGRGRSWRTSLRLICWRSAPKWQHWPLWAERGRTGASAEPGSETTFQTWETKICKNLFTATRHRWAHLGSPRGNLHPSLRPSKASNRASSRVFMSNFDQLSYPWWKKKNIRAWCCHCHVLLTVLPLLV